MQHERMESNPDAYEELLKATMAVSVPYLGAGDEDGSQDCQSPSFGTKPLKTDECQQADVRERPEGVSVEVAEERGEIASAVDSDMGHLSDILDAAYYRLKEAAKVQVLDIKTRLIEASTLKNDELERELNTEINQKQDSIEMLKERLAVLELHHRQSAALDEHRLQTIEISTLKHKKMIQLHKVFRSWRRITDKTKALVHIECKFAVPSYEKTVQRRFFAWWRNKVIHTTKQKRDDFWKSQINLVTRKLVSKYENALQELRLRLDRSEAEVQFHLQNKQKLEREMKQAFMRSVSTLNLEAMSMFSAQNSDALASLGLKSDGVERSSSVLSEEEPRQKVPTPSRQ